MDEFTPFVPTIPNLLHWANEHYADQALIEKAGRRLTFSGLERESMVLAKQLVAQGVTKGTRVGILLPNDVEFPVVFMAAARIGAIVLPMSTLYQPRELQWVIRHADIDTLFIADSYMNHNYIDRLETAIPEITKQDMAPLFIESVPYLRQIIVVGDETPLWATNYSTILQQRTPVAINDAFIHSMEAAVTPSDWAFMIYTSGSTADPKGVVHTHGNAMRHSCQMANVYGIPKTGERVAVSRPYFWIAGLSGSLFYALHAGFTLVIPDSASAAAFYDLVINDDIDFVCAGAAIFAAMNHLAKASGSGLTVTQLVTDYAGVCHMDNGRVSFTNERMESALAAKVAQENPDAMPSIYGMTETTSAYVSVPPPGRLTEDKAGFCGQPAAGAFVRIVDPVTREPLPPGQPGELLAGGYSLMAGLYKKERHETFVGECLYPTGDMCAVDEDGWVKFVTRLGDMIKISGANVAPLEVELLLNREPGIGESAVVGVKEESGIELVAAVIADGSVTLDQPSILNRLKGELSSFKVPKRIVIVDEETMPRTATGKIKKRDLPELLLLKNCC